MEGVVAVLKDCIALCHGEVTLGNPDYFHRSGRRFIYNEKSFLSGCNDFEIVPRDPETYKDWQVGDKVCEDEHRNACYEVIFRSGELVFFKDWNNYATNPFTCSEAFRRLGFRLVLTDIEKLIIEEKPAEDMQALIAKELDGYTVEHVTKSAVKVRHRSGKAWSLTPRYDEDGAAYVIVHAGTRAAKTLRAEDMRPAA